MALEFGVDSFVYHSNALLFPDYVLKAFFDARIAILGAFSAHPEYITKPYEYSRKLQNISIASNKLSNHPIHDAIVGLDLQIFGDDLLSHSGWRTLKNVRGRSYALIDMACYLVHLLNVYQPNKALIQNLISTHSKIDALGRENNVAAENAIDKVFKRTFKDRIYTPDREAGHIVMIAKYEMSQINKSVPGNRGIDFERLCEARLQDNGFQVQITPMSGDFGADLIAFKDDLGFAIQCKNTSKPVGVKAVQEAVAARAHYQTDFAVVCSAAGFTDAAIELGSSNKTILCNADQLVKRLDAI